MFHNLIESQSHRREFRRRGSFFLFTVAAYAVIIFGAGIGSIYAYDAQLEAQANSLELMSWVPPVTPAKPIIERSPAGPRSRSNAPVDPTASRPERTVLLSRTDDPRNVPPTVGTIADPAPPATHDAILSNRNVDPPTAKGSDKGDCLTCPSTTQTVVLPDKAPEPPPVKPPTTLRVPSTILSGKAISLPQPPYPIIAKQAHVQGPVSIQILVNEEGKVLSAQVVSGNAMLSSAAKDAAMRARFSPTMLNGSPVKIQGVITYNFTLQ
ncbi:MAG TPA: TonB family protein [Pyrinomonadaceae bacterium]|nr:TonB family protein [Pyrinomonadaceae bacterium]